MRNNDNSQIKNNSKVKEINFKLIILFTSIVKMNVKVFLKKIKIDKEDNYDERDIKS